MVKNKLDESMIVCKSWNVKYEFKSYLWYKHMLYGVKCFDVILFS